MKTQAAFNPEINYQGKLLDTNTGDPVATNDYNFEFKLYDAPSGGNLVWTETRTGADKVTVTNGLFSVMLGSVSSLTGVNFNQTLYLTVNVGGTGSPSWDGEMSPRKRLGAVTAAFEADHLDGLNSTDFLSTSTFSAPSIGSIGSSSATTTAAGNFVVTGTTRLASSLTGILRATAGYVTTGLVNLATEVTGILGISNGGTGIATTPGYGEVLIGDGSGYTLMSTSSLGITGSSQWLDSGSDIYFDTGNVSIGASPSGNAKLTVTTDLGDSMSGSALSVNLGDNESAYAGGALGFKDSGGLITPAPTYVGAAGVASISSSTANAIGLYAAASGGMNNWAGYFVGNVEVAGGFVSSTEFCLNSDCISSWTAGSSLWTYGGGTVTLASSSSVTLPDTLVIKDNGSGFAGILGVSTDYATSSLFTYSPVVDSWFMQGATQFQIQDGGSLVLDSGRIGVGTTTPDYSLSVDGNVGFIGTNFATTTIGSYAANVNFGAVNSFLGDIPYIQGNSGVGSLLVNKGSFYSMEDTVTNANPVIGFMAADLSVAATITLSTSTGQLVINSNATTSATQGFDIMSGCFAINGVCANFSTTSADYWLTTNTTDNLTQGATNLYWSNTLFDNRLSASSSIAGITTLSNLTSVGTITSGTWSATQIGVTKGGTGLTGAPSYGQVLVGNASNGYTLTATSGLAIAISDTTGTLAVNRGGTNITNPTAAGILLGSYAGGGWQQLTTSTLGLLTTDVAEGSRLYWTDTRFDNRLSASSSIAGITTLSNLASVGTITSGTWSATQIGVTKGGTGLTGAPSYGQVLVGNASSGYTLTATSGLGIAISDTTGTLAINRGGTNTTSQSTNGIAYYNGTSITSGTGFVFNGTNVGIGTSTPFSTLSVSTTSQSSEFSPLFTVASTTFATLFTVLGNGNIGISTTTPADRLVIEKTGDANNYRMLRLQNYSTGVSAVSGMEINAGANTNGGLIYYRGSGNSSDPNSFWINNVQNAPLIFANNNAEKMRINTGGNVGIGTTTPFALLNIDAPSTADNTFNLGGYAGSELSNSYASSSAGTNRSAKFSLQSGTASFWDLRVNSNTYAANAATGNNLVIERSDNAGNILLNPEGGKVGIGSSAPGALLSIANGANDSGNYGKALQITNASGNSQQIAFIRAGNNVVSAGYNGATAVWGFGSGQTTDALFAPTYLAIDAANSRIGIGTTTPAYKFQVAGSAAFGLVQNSKRGVYLDNEDAYGTSPVVQGISSTLGGSKLAINPTGDFVGIGTTTPNRMLTIWKSGSRGEILLCDNASSFVDSTTQGCSYISSEKGKFGIAGQNSQGSGAAQAITVDQVNLRLGVASATPLSALSVNGAGTGTGLMAQFADSANTPRVTILDNGNVGIGAVSPGVMLDLGTAGSKLGVLRLAGNTSGNVTVNVAAAAGTWTMTLPTTAGSSGQQLQTNGSGVTSWQAASSLRSQKNIIGQIGTDGILDRLLHTPVYRFHYKEGMGTGDSDTEYVGIMADEAPWAMHYNGTILNPINTFGYSLLGIQATNERIDALEHTLASTTANTLVVSQNTTSFDTLTVQHAATFYGTITVYGEANFTSKVVFSADVEIAGHLTLGKDSSGTATIKKDEDHVEVVFDTPYKAAPRIILTPQGPLAGREYWISDKTETGFTINFNTAVDEDFDFDWLAIAPSPTDQSATSTVPDASSSTPEVAPPTTDTTVVNPDTSEPVSSTDTPITPENPETPTVVNPDTSEPVSSTDAPITPAATDSTPTTESL